MRTIRFFPKALAGFFLFLLLVLFHGELSAVERETHPLPLPVIISFSGGDTISGGEILSAWERVYFSRTLMAEISGTDGMVMAWEISGPGLPDSGGNDDIAREMILIGAPGWLSVQFRKNDDIYSCTALYYSIRGNRILFTVESSDYIQSVLRNPVRLLRPVRDGLRGILPDLHVSLSEDSYSAPLLIKAPPGSFVIGLPGGESDKIRVGPEGKVTVNLPAPGLYKFSVHSPYHYPWSGSAALGISGAETAAEPAESGPHFLDFYLADMNVPGFEWGYRFGRTRRFYLKAGGFSYLFTLQPLAGEREDFYQKDGILVRSSRGFFINEPLTVLNAHAGLILGPAFRPYRFYGSIGLFGRIVHSSRYFGPDPVGPGGVVGTFGLEFDSGRRVRIYGEINPLFYLTRNVQYLKSLYDGGKIVSPFLFDLDGFFTLRSGRAGMRILL